MDQLSFFFRDLVTGNRFGCSVQGVAGRQEVPEKFFNRRLQGHRFLLSGSNLSDIDGFALSSFRGIHPLNCGLAISA